MGDSNRIQLRDVNCVEDPGSDEPRLMSERSRTVMKRNNDYDSNQDGLNLVRKVQL